MRPFSRPVIPDKTVRVRRAQVHCTTRTGHGILGTGRNRHKDGKECTRCVAGPTPKNLVCRSRNRNIPAERPTQRQARSRLLGLRAIRDNVSIAVLANQPLRMRLQSQNRLTFLACTIVPPPSHTYSPPCNGIPDHRVASPTKTDEQKQKALCSRDLGSGGSWKADPIGHLFSLSLSLCRLQPTDSRDMGACHTDRQDRTENKGTCDPPAEREELSEPRGEQRPGHARPKRKRVNNGNLIPLGESAKWSQENRAENGCAVEANLLVYNYAFSAGGLSGLKYEPLCSAAVPLSACVHCGVWLQD